MNDAFWVQVSVTVALRTEKLPEVKVKKETGSPWSQFIILPTGQASLSQAKASKRNGCEGATFLAVLNNDTDSSRAEAEGGEAGFQGSPVICM